jgi:hypothetical protein
MKTGVHTKHGGFQVMASMLPHYLVPDLEGFDLKPYVANYSEQRHRGRSQGDAAAQQQAEGQKQRDGGSIAP